MTAPGIVFVLTFLGLLVYSYSIWPYQEHSQYYLHSSVERNVPAGMFTVPVEIFIIESTTAKVKYTDEDLTRILDSANDIWRNNANITFHIVEINRIMVPEERAEPEKSNRALESIGRDFLAEKFLDDTIDIIIVKSLKGSEEGGGIAHDTFRAVMENEFENESWAIWNLSHELGHKLNLFDVYHPDNLMQAELPWNVMYKKLYLPTGLAKEQVLTTRDWVYKTYCPDDSCILR